VATVGSAGELKGVLGIARSPQLAWEVMVVYLVAKPT
jgi:hypothetical protein